MSKIPDGEPPISSGPDALLPLRLIAGKILAIEAELDTLRDERDAEIARVTRLGATERAAADAAGVGAGYAHRAAVHGRNARRVRT